MLDFRHFISVESLSKSDIFSFFSYVDALKADVVSAQKTPLKEKLALCFWENSTRTKVSFDVGARQAGFETFDLNIQSSSVQKGESIADTLMTLQAMNIHTFVIRHADEKIFDELLNRQDVLKTGLSLINAGCGSRSHPTQALLDAFTLYEYFKALGQGIENKRILFWGDVAHSRVVQSNVRLLKKLGWSFFAYVPEGIPSAVNTNKDVLSDIQILSKPQSVLSDIDCVMCLRSQDERWQSQFKNNQTPTQDVFGMQELKQLKASAAIMHPGPFRRNIDLSDDCINHKSSLIWQQVHNGVWVRQALLEMIAKNRAQKRNQSL